MAGRADRAGACQGSEQFPQRDELDAFLKENSIPGIAGIDTRALTKILRGSGTMNGMITTEEYPDLEETLPRGDDGLRDAAGVHKKRAADQQPFALQAGIACRQIFLSSLNAGGRTRTAGIPFFQKRKLLACSF